jgi:hypothetical protein
MALQYSVAVRNAQLDAVESTIGASAVLKLYDLAGAAPANCAAAITATTVASITLGADWMDAANSGSKAKSAGAWQDASADADGTIDFWRLFASDGTTCGAQGTVTSTATGTGDMLIDNPVVTTGQSITISTFTIAAGNA